jgi:hypothetical protein
MASFTRPPAKKRRIVAVPASTKRTSLGAGTSTQAASAQPVSATITNTTPVSETSDPLEPPLDDLDVVRDVPPEDLDDGMEQFDNGVVQQAVLVALDEMKHTHNVIVSSDELKNARDVLTKV